MSNNIINNFGTTADGSVIDSRHDVTERKREKDGQACQEALVGHLDTAFARI